MLSPRNHTIAPARANAVFETPAGDGDLVVSSRSGRRHAFHRLVDRYKDRVFTLAFRFLGDRGEAEDLAQETFLRAYESIDGFRGESRFSTWLYRICRNLCLKRLARQRTEPASSDSLSELLPDSAARPPEQLMAKERSLLVRWGISRLRPEFREVIALYCTETLSYEEIADSLDVPIGTVRSRLHRGREELKEILRPYFSKEES